MAVPGESLTVWKGHVRKKISIKLVGTLNAESIMEISLDIASLMPSTVSLTIVKKIFGVRIKKHTKNASVILDATGRTAME